MGRSVMARAAASARAGCGGLSLGGVGGWWVAARRTRPGPRASRPRLRRRLHHPWVRRGHHSCWSPGASIAAMPSPDPPGCQGRRSHHHRRRPAGSRSTAVWPTSDVLWDAASPAVQLGSGALWGEVSPEPVPVVPARRRSRLAGCCGPGSCCQLRRAAGSACATGRPRPGLRHRARRRWPCPSTTTGPGAHPMRGGPLSRST